MKSNGPNRLRLNKTVAASITPPPKGRTYFYDDKTSGLCLCVTAAGSRTFYSYRKVHGQPVRIRLGRFPELTVEQARKLAAAINGDIAQGGNPHEAKRAARNESTFGDLFTHWLEVYKKPHRKTWVEDQRKFDKHLVRWKSRKLGSITTTEVRKLHRQTGEKNGPYLANRLLALIHAVFEKAPELGGLVKNPAHGIEKFPEKSRERFLHGDELRRFFAAVRAEADHTMRDFFLVLLFTGARRSNVQAMRWDQIDLSGGYWSIPETKSGQSVLLPLVGPAIEILEHRAENHNGSPWVFPANSVAGHLVEPRKAWVRVINRAEIPDLRMHDLRRTLGSWQALCGSSLPVIGASLGHSDLKATQVYARLTDDAVRKSTNRAVDAMLAAVQSETEGNGNGE